MELKDSMKDCLDDAPGTIYADWEQDGYRCLIMRGPCSICGYIGMKEGHPAFGKDYNDIDVRCHGGLTFAHDDKTGGDRWPSGWWWFGWDYAHYGDVPFYDLRDGRVYYDDQEWSPKDVCAEFPEIIEEFNKVQ